MGEHVRLTALRASAAAVFARLRGRPHPRWRKFLRDTWGHPRVVRRGRPVVWVVCAAGGEVVQTWSFCPALRAALPDATLVLSTSNHAFLDVAQRIGGLDACIYTPWDLPGPCGRALASVRPDLLISVESAWTPVLLRTARRDGLRALLASGTITADYHRAASYRRPMRLRVLDELTVVGVKDEAEADAFAALGVAPTRLRVLGDLRLDPRFYEVGAEERARLAAWAGVRPDDRLLVAGSLHVGEEAVALDATLALRASDPRIRLLVAPRHLAAVPILETACRARGLDSARMSAHPAGVPDRPAVLVLDTYGDLRAVYSLATWVLLGGTLVEIGVGLGQNLLEPLAQGVPVFFGPHTRRWSRLTRDMLAIHPGLRVLDAVGLATGIHELVAAPARVSALRDHARAVLAGGADAVGRHVAAVTALLDSRVPSGAVFG